MPALRLAFRLRTGKYTSVGMAPRMNDVPRSFQVHERDNVATLLQDAAPGAVRVLGSTSERMVSVREPIHAGHKLALGPIAAGDPVIKFGVAIGTATCAIQAGEWVHLHNCRSNFDELRTLDRRAGVATETRYE
jgi:altronate dehydratase small subunit